MDTQDSGAHATVPSDPVITAGASEHAIYLLYPFRWDPAVHATGTQTDGKADSKAAAQPFGLSLDLTKLREAAWQPKLSDRMRDKAEKARQLVDAHAAAAGAGRAAAVEDVQPPATTRGPVEVWDLTDWPIAADMDPQLARLLSQESGGRLDTNTVKVWALGKQGNIRDALNGATGLARYLKPKAAVTFASAAIKRMRARFGEQTPPKMAVLKVAVKDPGGTDLKRGARLDKATFDEANARAKSNGQPEATSEPTLLALPIEFGEVRAVGFRTGHGLLVAEVRVLSGEPKGVVALSVLVEALVALCGDRQMTWLSSDGSELDAQGGNSGLRLHDMLATLLGDAAKHVGTAPRMFTYTYAGLDSVMDPLERQRLMIRLACKYTDDYRIDPDAFSERIYQPFESVSHLAALEGAVTLVENVPHDDRAGPSFLAEFVTNAIERRYLPVAVLAYHALIALLHLTQESRRWIELGAPSRADVDRLREVQESILEFRLFHSLTHVSLLTMLNEFHSRLVHAFGLERMLAIADRDVAEIGSWLELRLRQAEARRAGKFRRLTAAALAFISGAALGKVLTQAVTHIPLQWIQEHSTGVGHTLEFGLAIGFGWIGWRWAEGRDGHTREQQQDIAAEKIHDTDHRTSKH